MVGRFGEPLHLQHQKQFLLLPHYSWFVKAHTQENAVVTWLHKLTVEHPYEWRRGGVRIRVWLIGGYRDLMGVAWDRRFHSVWVTGTALLMVWVRRLLFGKEAIVGEAALVQYVFLLSYAILSAPNPPATTHFWWFPHFKIALTDAQTPIPRPIGLRQAARGSPKRWMPKWVNKVHQVQKK